MTFSECHLRALPVCAPFYPALLAAATVIFADGAAAQMQLDETCVEVEGSETSCAHAVACIGDDLLLVGQAIGWDQGLLQGEMSSGTTCTGVWSNIENVANFTCEDGMTGIVTYSFKDPDTNVAVGAGQTIVGLPINAWSGADLAAYIAQTTGARELTCGAHSVTLN
ncbi:hypothetical protein [Gymnodinialimonas hymeniacidonis]|uniref:hypothetical protein n=1 Tax=Gymnodinialimonas hymeniacidonis TaxID=3126508 RepID=UPI0034C63660